jgi:hypothetical protein
VPVEPHGGRPSGQAGTHRSATQAVPVEQHCEPHGGRWSGQAHTLLGPPLHTPPCGQHVAFGPHPCPDAPGMQVNPAGQQMAPPAPEHGGRPSGQGAAHWPAAQVVPAEQQTAPPAPEHGGRPSGQVARHCFAPVVGSVTQVVPAGQHCEPHGGRWSGQLHTLSGPPLHMPPCGQQLAFGPHPSPDSPGIQVNPGSQQIWPPRPEQQLVDWASDREGTSDATTAAARAPPMLRKAARRDWPWAMRRARSSIQRSIAISPMTGSDTPKTRTGRALELKRFRSCAARCPSGQVPTAPGSPRPTR